MPKFTAAAHALLVFASMACLPTSASAADEITTFYLVRHAEKASDDPRDPTLTPAGRARAQALAQRIDAAGLDAAYASQYRRTQLTAAPSAAAAGKPVTVRSPSDDATSNQRFADDLRRRHAGKRVLVVGHSNTIPALQAALTGKPPQPMADDEYDRLIVLRCAAAEACKADVVRY
jgi:broad specificity phosphatase PhoE